MIHKKKRKCSSGHNLFLCGWETNNPYTGYDFILGRTILFYNLFLYILAFVSRFRCTGAMAALCASLGNGVKSNGKCCRL